MRQRRDRRVPTLNGAGLLALVGGIEELVRECLRTRGVRELPSLLDTCVEFALKLLDSPR
jgi:hypothetical protein